MMSGHRRGPPSLDTADNYADAKLNKRNGQIAIPTDARKALDLGEKIRIYWSSEEQWVLLIRRPPVDVELSIAVSTNADS